MKAIRLQTIFLIAFLFSLTAFLSSCQNSASAEEEEHSDPFGVALVLNGVEIAKQENGMVTYDQGDFLSLTAGDETDLITIRWIDEDGDRFVPNEAEGYGLQWQVGNEDITEVEQHAEDGAWSFHLVGLAAGDTDVRFQLFHNDHSDFTSMPFEVRVEEPLAANDAQ